MSILDHLGIAVTDFDRSVAFYKAALAPLGIALVNEHPGAAGFGTKTKPDFWIAKGDEVKGRIHVGFRAAGRAAVKAFYDAAIAAGATDNGPPGVREQNHPNYYSALVLDPDGHNIEAVCHEAYLG